MDLRKGSCLSLRAEMCLAVLHRKLDSGFPFQSRGPDIPSRGALALFKEGLSLGEEMQAAGPWLMGKFWHLLIMDISSFRICDS
jgi:hypothetical protein